MSDAWRTFLAKSASDTGAVATLLRKDFETHEERQQAMEAKLYGWTVASKSSSTKKTVWTPIVELECYTLYRDASAALRCRKARVGLFHETATLVLGIVVDDVCVCAMLAYDELRTLRLTRRSIDVASVCAEDLINAANYAASRPEMEDCTVKGCSCPRKPDCRVPRISAGDSRMAHNKSPTSTLSFGQSVEIPSNDSDGPFTEDTEIELVFADGSDIRLSFSSPHESRCFCEILNLVCSFHGIVLE